MNANLPEMFVLAECPHLAAITVLEVALETTLRILRATYPNVSHGIESVHDLSAEDAYVDCVIQQSEALKHALSAYRLAVEAGARYSFPPPHRSSPDVP